MAEIKFSMRSEVLNTFVGFAKSFVDMKSRMVQLRNAHCVAHGYKIEVSLVNNNAAAKVVVPILDEIKDGTEFNIKVPKRVDTRIYPTVSFTVDTGADTCEFKAGGLCETVELEQGAFPNIDSYWTEQEDVRKIGLNPALLMNALKAFDKNVPVVLSMTSAKKPLYITQGDSKKCFVLPMRVAEVN